MKWKHKISLPKASQVKDDQNSLVFSAFHVLQGGIHQPNTQFLGCLLTANNVQSDFFNPRYHSTESKDHLDIYGWILLGLRTSRSRVSVTWSLAFTITIGRPSCEQKF
eukprot:8331060-Pyramimonas_sp.AAC.1